jgi:AcrR family transcriptional regulator
MDLQNRIITTTLRMMMRIGVSSTTMDNIAKECGISKRTLYEQFPDKLTLITKAFHYNQEKQCEKLSQVFNESNNQLEAILKIYTLIRDNIGNTSQALIEDIRRLYPALYLEYIEAHKSNNRYLIDILKKAQSEGLIRDNINIEIAGSIFAIMLQNSKQTTALLGYNVSLKEILDQGFLTFLRGMASENGLMIIEQFLTNYVNKNYNSK